MTWILVLTLIGWDYRGGHSIEHVPGFADEASCRNAGDAWLKHLPQTNYVAPRAICLPQQVKKP